MARPHLKDAWSHLARLDQLSPGRAHSARTSDYLARLCDALQPGQRLVLTSDGPRAATLEEEDHDLVRIVIRSLNLDPKSDSTRQARVLDETERTVIVSTDHPDASWAWVYVVSPARDVWLRAFVGSAASRAEAERLVVEQVSQTKAATPGSDAR
jgi:hypothetical protein